MYGALCKYTDTFKQPKVVLLSFAAASRKRRRHERPLLPDVVQATSRATVETSPRFTLIHHARQRTRAPCRKDVAVDRVARTETTQSCRLCRAVNPQRRALDAGATDTLPMYVHGAAARLPPSLHHRGTVYAKHDAHQDARCGAHFRVWSRFYWSLLSLVFRIRKKNK